MPLHHTNIFQGDQKKKPRADAKKPLTAYAKFVKDNYHKVDGDTLGERSKALSALWAQRKKHAGGSVARRRR